MAGALSKVPTSRLYMAQQRAMVRLQLWFTGQTSQMILDFQKQARDTILSHVDKDGKLDSSATFQVQTKLLSQWGDVQSQWVKTFNRARAAAAQIAFGTMGVIHDRYVQPNIGNEIQESVTSGVFNPQIQILMDKATEKIYDDGLNLSSRIWSDDRNTRDAINKALMQGLANKDSAWNIAKNIEDSFGANDDCPRWTSTRLYGLTKDQIADDNPAGLQGATGSPCDGSGVSYRALRLARTELQRIHAAATDSVMEQSPWVQKEQINLSPAHAEDDECDDVASGGENGDGVYEVGEIELPIHPNCLCFATAVMMDQDEFTSKLADWTKGTGDWPEMDDYAKDLGAPIDTDFSDDTSVLALVVLVFENADKISELLK